MDEEDDDGTYLDAIPPMDMDSMDVGRGGKGVKVGVVSGVPTRGSPREEKGDENEREAGAETSRGISG